MKPDAYGCRFPLRAAWSLLVLCLVADAGGVTPTTLDHLMGLLREVQSVDADYTETIEVSLLTQAMTTRGHLHYEAPDRIVKTDSRGESIRIEGNRLLIEDASGLREVAITDFVALEHLVVALRATFSGDLEALRSRYELAFRPADEGVEGRWSLSLRPRERRLFQILAQIEIGGRGETIDRIELQEPNGDRRVLRMRVTRRIPERLP
jgi:hypothetical protein